MNARFEVAVLGRAREAAAVAAASGCAAAAHSPARTAIVVTVGSPPGVAAAAAFPAAARTRDRLRTRDIDAHAAGRLVWCAVTGERDAARAAAAGAPAVLAVCGPRTAWTDELLADAGSVVLAADPADTLTALALHDLRARGLDARVLAPPAGVRAGLARLGLARGRLTEGAAT